MPHAPAERAAARTEQDEVFRLRPAAGGPLVRRLVDAPLERLLGLAHLGRLYRGTPPGCEGYDFLVWGLATLGIRAAAADGDLDRVPETGPAVVVANHPFGGVEGMVLGRLLMTRRRDVKFLANYFLGRIPELRDLFLLVDPFDRPGSVRKNLATLREALRWVADGGLLVVFPAGEVAHLSLRQRRIQDPPWNPAVAGIIRRAGCPVLPVYFGGRNSALFQAVGLVHPLLRTALLARELLGRRGTTIEARIGSPIPFRQLDAHSGGAELVDYLRCRTYILSERPSAGSAPIQPRLTPRAAKPIVPPTPAQALENELGRLPREQILVEGDDQAVWVAEADQIPKLLREIGRLREATFREVGEGTGREVDLDVFDPSYRHLFIWSRADRQIVGAYRLGMTDELLRAKGTAGLYTSTLFDFKPRLFDSMGPALEMGRSFIRSEYQKSYAGLMLLWKGIGRFVIQHPRYATLFGPVSISATYQSASQRLIVAFLEQNKYAHPWSKWVHPHAPPVAGRRGSYPLSPANLENLDDVSSFIAEIEADQKGVPILLKQYLKLGGRLLGFNVDPEFSNVLDVLIMVDLRRTERKILQRYMGREGTAAFLAQQRVDARSQAS